MDNSVMQKIIDLQTEITKRDDLIAKLEVFIMLESKKRKIKKVIKGRYINNNFNF